MIGYAIYSINKYVQEGGLTGDIALIGEYGGQAAIAAGQPQIGMPLQAVGGIARRQLSPEQAKMGKLFQAVQSGQAEQLAARAAQASQAAQQASQAAQQAVQ